MRFDPLPTESFRMPFTREDALTQHCTVPLAKVDLDSGLAILCVCLKSSLTPWLRHLRRCQAICGQASNDSQSANQYPRWLAEAELARILVVLILVRSLCTPVTF